MLVRHSSQTRGMQSLQRRLAFAGRTIRDIRPPDMIAIFGAHTAQQIRIFHMIRMSRTRLRAWRNAGDAHFPHIPLNPFPIHGVAVGHQLGGHPSRAIKRGSRIDLVYAMFNRHFLRIRPDGPVIETRTVEAEQCRLQAHRYALGLWLQELQPFSARKGRGQIFF